MDQCSRPPNSGTNRKWYACSGGTSPDASTGSAGHIEFTLMAGNDQGRDAIPDHVYQRSRLAHEAIDAEDESHAGDRNGWNDGECSDQRDGCSFFPRTHA